MPALLDGVRRRSPRPNTRGRALRSRPLYDRDVLSVRFQTTKRPLRQGNRPARPQFGRGGMSGRDAAPPPSDRSPDPSTANAPHCSISPTALPEFSGCTSPPASLQAPPAMRRSLLTPSPVWSARTGLMRVRACSACLCAGLNALNWRTSPSAFAGLATEHPYYSANQLNCKERAQPRGRICAKGRHPLDFQPAPC